MTIVYPARAVHLGFISKPVSQDNVTGATPSDAEIETAFGTAAACGRGFIGIINDNGSGAALTIVASDGTNWWYKGLTKAT